MEKVLIQGDLAPLTVEERVDYYKKVCQSLHLNPMTRPFDYILFREFDNAPAKLSLYANKSCAEQLRKMHGVSVTNSARTIEQDCAIYEVTVTDRTGRSDSAAGIVPLFKFKEGRRIDFTGREWANAVMKAHTKAKRRATLSICGLAFMDESELDTMEVMGGVTPQDRVYRYPEIEERTTGSREAAQAVAQRKIEEAKAPKPAEPEIVRPEPPERAWLGTVEIDHTDEASPIVRGDIGNLLEMIQKHCTAEWRGDWWHIKPKDVETIRAMCDQIGYRLMEIIPKPPSGPKDRKTAPETKPQRRGRVTLCLADCGARDSGARHLRHHGEEPALAPSDHPHP